jgi:hypothetical protein
MDTCASTKERYYSFLFFQFDFYSCRKHSETELSQILLHEQMHVRQCHSIDIILIEVVCLFSWWNPFVWLLKREMTMNLEYLADSGVLHKALTAGSTIPSFTIDLS